MPIKGMTDQAPSFPQIGVIRKGAPKPKDEKRPGKDLKHFRVEFDGKEAEAADTFANAYGPTPAEINILIPFDQIDRNWEAWREAYVAGAMIHRCDGENVVYALNPKTGEVLIHSGRSVETHQPVACDGLAKCKPTGRLRVIVPELQRLAYLVILTTSIHDIINISNQLAAIKEMNGSRLRGIPLILRRRPKMISTPSGPNGKRARREKWLISIEADPKWVQAKMEQIQMASFPALPVPTDDSVEAEYTTAQTDNEPEIGVDLANGKEEESAPARWFEESGILDLAREWVESKDKTWEWALQVLEVPQIDHYPGTRENAKELWEAALKNVPETPPKTRRQGALC